MEPFYDDDVDAQTASQLVHDGALLLDVRTNDEWNEGHVPGATHIELQTLPERAGEIAHDRKVVVICHSGGRSARAVAFLRSSGVDAVNIAGGIIDWPAAGLPVETADG